MPLLKIAGRIVIATNHRVYAPTSFPNCVPKTSLPSHPSLHICVRVQQLPRQWRWQQRTRREKRRQRWFVGISICASLPRADVLNTKIEETKHFS